MANVLIEESTLAEIGEAIRDKAKVTKQFLPAEMPNAIKSIHTGNIPEYDTLYIQKPEDIKWYDNEGECSCPATHITIVKDGKIPEGCWTSLGYVEELNLFNVTEVPDGFSSNCYYLEEVNAPKLNKIGAGCFYDPFQLSLTLPSITSLDNIGGYNSELGAWTFEGVSKLYLPNLITFGSKQKEFYFGDITIYFDIVEQIDDFIGPYGGQSVTIHAPKCKVFNCFLEDTNIYVGLDLPLCEEIKDMTIYCSIPYTAWLPDKDKCTFPSCKIVGSDNFICYHGSEIELHLPVVESIGDNCFSSTTILYLDSITHIPSLGNNAFDSDENPDTFDMQIYVPASKLDTIKAHPDWSKFASAIYPIEN